MYLVTASTLNTFISFKYIQVNSYLQYKSYIDAA